MARRKSPADPKAPEGSDEGAPFEVDAALLSEISGSQFPAFAMSLFRRAVKTIWFGEEPDPAEVDEAMQAMLDAFRGIKPRDEAEGVLAAQMLATHNAAMECMRRTMLPGQTFEGRDQNLKHAVKLMSLYERQLAAFDKRRGGGRQKITVEHVNVHAGGQALSATCTPRHSSRIRRSHNLLRSPPRCCAMTAHRAAMERSWRGHSRRGPLRRPRRRPHERAQAGRRSSAKHGADESGRTLRRKDPFG